MSDVQCDETAAYPCDREMLTATSDPASLYHALNEAVDEIEKLKKHSRMLGRIASTTSNYCQKETDTALLAVARMKAILLEYQAKEAWDLVTQLEKESLNE